MKRGVVSIALVMFWLVSGFRFSDVDQSGSATGPDRTPPPVQVGGQSLFPDSDSDGLSDDVEEDGWENGAGLFITNPLDRDSDDDGLTDGQEKLYDTNPLDDKSPGIYVEYGNDLKTSKYFPWDRYGSKFIAVDSAVVRRGATFYVGGPADATIQIQKSLGSLTTLTPNRGVCSGRWEISIPAGGTVGKYTIKLQKGDWNKSLNLYVIFELPSNMSDADVAAYVYGDDPDNFRDEYAIWFVTSDDRNNSWDAWPSYHQSKGFGYRFQTDQYQAYVFEDHVIDAINGYTSQNGAVTALGHHLDGIFRLEFYSLRYNMWAALHAYNQQAQCSTHASALTSFARGAGIPARPVVVDWDMHVMGDMLFDHSTEVWLSGNWKVMRAYRGPQEVAPEPIAKGILPPKSRTSWFYRDSAGDIVVVADSNWVWEDMQTHWSDPSRLDYQFGNYDNTRIVRWDWVAPQVTKYNGWGWGQEPADVGDPYVDWLPWPSSVSASEVVVSVNESGVVTEGPDESTIAQAQRYPEVEIGRVIADYGVDINGNGRFDQLVVEVEVNVTQPGYYSIGGLIDSPQFTSYAKVAGLASAATYTYLEAGLQTARLVFDGISISQARVDGPYQVTELWISNLSLDSDPIDLALNTLDRKDPGYITAAYKASDFDTLGAAFSDLYSERGEDSDRDGLYESLTLDVGLEISTPGAYVVAGDLYDRWGELISQVTWTGSDLLATLRFDEIRGVDGPYTLRNLYLLNADDEIIDSRVQAYTTQQVTAAEIKTHIVDKADLDGMGAEAILPGLYSDAGVDTDGDGRYDQLVITTKLVIEPGEGGQAYRIEGWLVDQNDSLIAWAISDPKVLAEGTQSLTLSFDGRIINMHGVDGPYKLIALKALPGDTYSVLDELDIAHLTQAYSSDEFEDPAIESGGSRIFEDNMEHGSGQWTATGTVWSLSDNAWHSYSHAWEADTSGSESGSLRTAVLDISLRADPMLRFRTCYAMQSPDDKGFVEVSMDDGEWTHLATYAGSSSQWSTQFVDLSSFDDVPTLQVRFRASSQGGLQWYVDDVYVSGLADDDGDGLSNIDEDLNGDGDPTNDDEDGDGVPNYLEPNDVDTDGDGIPNNRDPDDDGDGVPTASEDPDGTEGPSNDDSDYDGVPNYLDTDDDNDGIPTADEDPHGFGNPAYHDTDRDGVPNYLDPDDDGDGIPTADEDLNQDGSLNNDNSDGDNLPNYLDADDDGDGVPTADEDVENRNGDPRDDDSDDDGTPDYLDPDDDNDGIPSADEDFDGDGNPANDDSDGDGAPNYLDPDDDEDGIPTSVEGATKDADGDHVPDYLEPNNKDTDLDGTNDYLDDDDDGDGVPTADEDWNGDGNPTNDDGNNNAIPDYLDPDINERPTQFFYFPLIFGNNK